MDNYENLKVFTIIAQLNNIPLNIEQLIHTYAINKDLDEAMIIRISKKVGLKSSYIKVKLKK